MSPWSSFKHATSANVRKYRYDNRQSSASHQETPPENTMAGNWADGATRTLQHGRAEVVTSEIAGQAKPDLGNESEYFALGLWVMIEICLLIYELIETLRLWRFITVPEPFRKGPELCFRYER